MRLSKSTTIHVARSAATLAALITLTLSPQLRLEAGESGSTVMTVQEESKAWSAAFSGRFGWNSNPRQFPNDSGLPPGFNHKDSWFTGLTAELGYEFTMPAESKLSIGYRGEFIFFHDIADFDRVDNKASLHYEHNLSTEWQVAFDAADIHTLRDGKDFLNKAIFSPSLTRSLAPGIGMTLGYGYINLQLAPGVPAAADPDADIHQVYVGFSFDLTKSLKLSTTYTYSWILADGSDSDVGENEIEVGLSGTLTADTSTALTSFFSKLNLEAVYTRDYDDYRHANSGAVAAGKYTKQRDGIDNFHVSASYPLIQRPEGASTGLSLSIFAQYEAVALDSNLAGNSYDQNVVQAGLRGEF